MRRRRIVKAAVLVGLLAATEVGAANAAAPQVFVSGTTLHVNSAAGRENSLNISTRYTPTASYIVIRDDSGIPSYDPDDCTYIWPNAVSCPYDEQLRSLVVRAGDRNDSVVVQDTPGLVVTVNGDAGDDKLTIHAGTARGGDGNDTIISGSYDDTLIGGNGNDRLYGGSSADVLVGNAGIDYLDGGLDRVSDDLRGGTGVDTCYHGVTDVESGCERIVPR